MCVIESRGLECQFRQCDYKEGCQSRDVPFLHIVRHLVVWLNFLVTIHASQLEYRMANIIRECIIISDKERLVCMYHWPIHILLDMPSWLTRNLNQATRQFLLQFGIRLLRSWSGIHAHFYVSSLEIATQFISILFMIFNIRSFWNC